VKGVLLTGAETINSVIKVAQEGPEKFGWPEGGAVGKHLDTGGIEVHYSLALPIRVYPLIETAVRASKGHSPEKHNKYLGELFARYSEVNFCLHLFLLLFFFFFKEIWKIPIVVFAGGLQESTRVVPGCEAFGGSHFHTLALQQIRCVPIHQVNERFSDGEPERVGGAHDRAPGQALRDPGGQVGLPPWRRALF